MSIPLQDIETVSALTFPDQGKEFRSTPRPKSYRVCDLCGGRTPHRDEDGGYWYHAADEWRQNPTATEIRGWRMTSMPLDEV